MISHLDNDDMAVAVRVTLAAGASSKLPAWAHLTLVNDVEIKAPLFAYVEKDHAVEVSLLDGPVLFGKDSIKRWEFGLWGIDFNAD